MSAEYEGIPDEDIWSIDFADLEFQKEIARGSFGKVYKGSYLGVDVAIKQIIRHNDPAYIKYVEREISVLKGIRHPFIVGFCGVCLHESGLYIVTEFVDGGDVRSIMKKQILPWSKRIQIAHDLAKAMFYLHSKKIIHRDLKSKNLLMGGDGRVRLCDFGFARLSEFRFRRSMTICGTPGFVAPEVMMGEDYDYKCDLFSFGNVIAELITLKRPGKDFWERMADDGYQLKLEELRALAPSDCPEKFLDLAFQCCAYNPQERPDFNLVIKALKPLEAEYVAKEKGQQQTSDLSKTPPSRKNGILSSHRLTVSNDNNQITKALEQMKVNEQEITDQSYLQTISADKIELTTSEIIIAEKHLAKMLARATNPDYHDAEYAQDLLLCYPMFTKPTTLLSLLIHRFSTGESFHVTPDDRKSLPPNPSDIAKRQQLVQIRIIVFLNTWIEKYWEDFLEPGMAELVQSFDSLTVHDKEPFSIEKKLQAKKQSLGNSMDRRVSTLKKNLDPNYLINVPAIQIAKQMALLDYNTFKMVKPREYLKEAWKKRSDSNVKALLARGKHYSRFVATCVVKTETKENRIAIINKFLDVAQNCLNYKDYNAFFAVMQGLSHPSVDRLSQTWQGLKQQTLQLYKGFQQLVSKDEHYKAYKQKQETSLAPSIPCLDVFLEEIAYVDSFNQDVGKGGIINFSKHRKMARMIRNIEQYGSAPYPSDVTPNDSIQDFILNTLLLDDDALQKKSLLIEQPSSFLV
mmetsp:Transcript_15855/g.22078  ORF Transcript_15855/g.22078 Transcript_15855/m.22078 type:complete len:744 (-) Transcript_15855:72-2303(-)